jgi:rhamnogalacturonan endolyase
MHDHTYRMAVAWQNTAYNQPPHLGYYLPDYFRPSLAMLDESAPLTQTITLDDSIVAFKAKWKKCTKVPSVTSIAPDGTKKSYSANLPGFTNTFDRTNKIFTLTGKPEQTGEYQFIVSLKGSSETVETTIRVIVEESPTNILQIATEQKDSEHYYNLQGQRIEKPQHGLYIYKGKKYIAR